MNIEQWISTLRLNGKPFRPNAMQLKLLRDFEHAPQRRFVMLKSGGWARCWQSTFPDSSLVAPHK